MMITPQSVKPAKKSAAPKMERQPSLYLCMSSPFRASQSREKPMIIPAAIWKGNKGPIMAKYYINQEAA